MCTSPNYMVWNGQYTHNDKPKFDFLGKIPYSKIRESKAPWIQVPCGQCLECRIQQARTWADRVVTESKKYEHNYFVTLTYDDEHIKDMSLHPRDMQLFLKRLRKRFPGTKIRFFGCGEYGDSSRRQHFHIILFNCPLDDLSYDFYYKVDGKYIHHVRPNNKGNLKFSRTIYECWQEQGMISVGEVTYDSAAYVSQYVTKKHKPGMKDYYEKLGIEPEFVRMSTHPGIGADYFHEHEEHILFDGNYIVASPGEAHVSVPPRYFDKLFIKKYGEDVFQHIRDDRIKRSVNKLNSHCHHGIDIDVDNRIKDSKIKHRHALRNQI